MIHSNILLAGALHAQAAVWGLQVQTALGAILRAQEAKQMPCGVFGSFGWSGEAVDEMEKRLQDAGFKLAFDSIRVKFKPTARDLQASGLKGRLLQARIVLVQHTNAQPSQLSAGQVHLD